MEKSEARWKWHGFRRWEGQDDAKKHLLVAAWYSRLALGFLAFLFFGLQWLGIGEAVHARLHC